MGLGFQFALAQLSLQGGAPPTGPDPLPFDETLNAAVTFWMNPSSFTDGTDVVTQDGANISVIKNALQDGVDGFIVGTPGTLSIEADGTPALQFSGSGDYSFGEPAALDFNGGQQWVVVAKLGDVIPSAGSGLLAKAGSTSSQRQYFLLYGANVIYMQTGGNPQSSNTSISAQDVLYYVCSGAIQSKRVNNIPIASRSSASNTNNLEVRLGGRSATDVPGGSGATLNSGSVRELFVFNRLLTEAEFSQVQAYFNAQ